VSVPLVSKKLERGAVAGLSHGLVAVGELEFAVKMNSAYFLSGSNDSARQTNSLIQL
jgi:hypothetical protein